MIYRQLIISKHLESSGKSYEIFYFIKVWAILEFFKTDSNFYRPMHEKNVTKNPGGGASTSFPPRLKGLRNK